MMSLRFDSTSPLLLIYRLLKKTQPLMSLACWRMLGRHRRLQQKAPANLMINVSLRWSITQDFLSAWQFGVHLQTILVWRPSQLWHSRESRFLTSAEEVWVFWVRAQWLLTLILGRLTDLEVGMMLKAGRRTLHPMLHCQMRPTPRPKWIVSKPLRKFEKSSLACLRLLITSLWRQPWPTLSRIPPGAILPAFLRTATRR